MTISTIIVVMMTISINNEMIILTITMTIIKMILIIMTTKIMIKNW